MSDDVRAARSRLGRVLATFVGTAVVLFVFGVLIGLLVVGRHGGGAIQGVDDTVERWYVGNRGSLVGISKLVATWLDAFPLGVAAALLTVVLLATIRTVRALVPALAYLGGEFQVYVIREIVLRHRPPTADFPAPGAVPGIHETSYSFPSGHAVAVTAIAFALALSLVLWRRALWPLLIVALAASLFVADTRLVLGVHWFSDVAFGWAIGAAWGLVVAVVTRRFEWSDLRALSGRTATPRTPTPG